MTKQLDTALSIELAERIKSKSANSFHNAHKAVLLTPTATYVQGFLVSADEQAEPIEYSWLEMDEQIIDPTFPHLNKNAEELYYFPAQSLSVKQLKAVMEEAIEDYPEDDPLPVYGEAPFEYYGDVMLGGKNYLDAYKAAEAKCRELNLPKIQDALP